VRAAELHSRPPRARSSAASWKADGAAIGLGEHRRLEPLDRAERSRERLEQRRACGDERRVGQPRHGPRGLRPQLRRLVEQPPALSLQLEQHRLGRVTREREHAAPRVVGVALDGDGGTRRGE
jgi:hypothetical protein